MKAKVAIALLVAVVLVAAMVLMRRGEVAEVRYEQAVVERTTVAEVIRETGMIATRDPVLARTHIEGRLEWIIEDGTWVEEGDRLFVINDDEALKGVTEARSELLTSRQELALARLRREHAERLEEQKVVAAERAHELARIRYRILSTPPKGGRRLIEIHEQLLPIEEQTARLRRDYEQAHLTYQKAQDAYLAALDRWQEQTDAIVRAQTRVDQQLIRSEYDFETRRLELGTEEEEKAKLAETRQELERLRADLPQLQTSRNAARARRDETKPLRDELLAKLEARDAEARELYVALEIEKRGVELAQLQLDRQIAKLTLAEARRKLEDGRVMFERGAISQAELDALQSKLDGAVNDLKILDEKIRIAARPETDEVLTEARLQMEQAEAKAANARSVRDRNLRALDQEIALLDAQIANSAYRVERLSKAFPSVVEFNINFLKREMEMLDAEETERRAEITEELARLATDLERASANPPDVALSPSTGVVELVRRWGRTYHAGDHVSEETVVVTISPPLNLEVRTALNEADVDRVEKGMAVRITVPALGGREMAGDISMVGGIGRDKFKGMSEGDRPAFAGVTQFETRIELKDVSTDLRPGMTVVIEIELGRQQDVLCLPRAAVRIQDDAAAVLTGPRDDPQPKSVEGRLFGDDVFIIDAGLDAGDVVWIERRQSR